MMMRITILFTLAFATPSPSLRSFGRQLQQSCNASAAPDNGSRGNCNRDRFGNNQNLESGKTCQPVCNAGYNVSGPTRCENGVLDAATCSPYIWETQADLDQTQICTFSAVQTDVDSAEACQLLCNEEGCLGVTYDPTASSCMLCSSWTADGVPCVGSACEHYERNKTKELLEQLYTWPSSGVLTFPVSGLTAVGTTSLDQMVADAKNADQATQDKFYQELLMEELLRSLYSWPKPTESKYVNDALTIAAGDDVADVMNDVAALTAAQQEQFLRELQIQQLLQELYNLGNEPSGSDFGFPNSSLQIRDTNDLEDVMDKVKLLDQADQEALLSDLTVQKEADLYFSTGGGKNVDDWLDEREKVSVNYDTAGFRGEVKDAIIKKLLTWHYRWQAEGVYTFDSVPIQADDDEVLEDFMANKVATLNDSQKNDLLDELQSCDTRENGAPADGDFGDCPVLLESSKTCQPGCRAGLMPSGPSFCINGIYNQPTCVPGSCAAQVAPANGTFGNCPGFLSSGSTCQPTCDAGYTISGQHSCFEAVLTQATCTPNACAAQVVISNGSFGDCPAQLSSGSTCQPTCEDGFTVSGTSSCLAGVLTSATCNPNPCNTVVAPANGSVGDCDPNSLVSGDTCQPVCDSGYTVSGVSTCLNGTLTMATCVSNDLVCDLSAAAPLNGTLGDCGNVLVDGQECQPTCNAGYIASGTHKCTSGVIQAATCEKAPEPEEEAPVEDDDSWEWWMWVLIALSILAAVLILALVIFMIWSGQCCGNKKQKVYVYRSHSQRMKIKAKEEREAAKAKAQNKV